MRQFNPEHNHEYTMVADTVATVVLTTSGQAQDYPTGAHLLHLSASVGCYVNFSSTGALVPTASLSATTATSGLSVRHNSGHEHFYRIPAGSTGYSIVGDSAGVATLEFWSE